jgi:two-component system cell cycle sensor histidine kinase PleC
VRTADGGLEISVTDYGPGMSQADLAKAMKPFDSPSSHIAADKQDTGLGLPLALAFAQLHDGNVVLDSRPGVGTTANIRLPAARISNAA